MPNQTAKREAGRPFKSPPGSLRLMGIVLTIVATGELLIMLVFTLLQRRYSLLTDALDPLLLTVISTPAIYYLVIRPVAGREHRQAEVALRQSEEKYRAILEQSADGIYILDPQNRRILEANSTILEMLGYTKEELCSLRTDDLVPLEKAEDIHIRISHLLDGAVLEAQPRIFRRKNGTTLETEINASAVTYGGRQVIMTNVRDVSDLRLARQLLAESEEKYRTLIEKSAEGIFLFDPESRRFLEANATLSRLLGYTKAELLTMCVDDLNPSETAPNHAQRVAEILAQGSLPPFPRQYRCKDGHTLEAESVAAIVHLGSKTVIMVNVRDLSGIRLAERTIAQSEEKYRALVEHSPDGIFYFSPFSKRIIDANPSMLDMFGYTREEMQGLPVGDLIADPPESIDVYTQQILKERTIRMPRRYKHKDGHILEVEINGTTICIGNETVIVSEVRDMTEVHRTQQNLAESEERFRSLFAYNRDAVCTVDLAGRILTMNRVAEELIGYPNTSFVGCPFLALASHKDRKWLWDYFEASLAGTQTAPDVDVTLRVVKGKGIILRLRWVPIILGGKISGAFGIARDVTTRLRNEQRIPLAAKVIESAAEAVVISDDHGIIQEINPAYSAVTGYTPEEAIGKLASFNFAENAAEFGAAIQASVNQTGLWKGEVWLKKKNGERCLILLSVNTVKDKAGKISNLFYVSMDITERKLAEEKISQQASHDALTGLPNRLLFTDRLRQGLIQAERTGNKLAVLFLDLDRFKNINDTLGHAVGDLLLQDVAQRLTSSMKAGDTVTRMGGDEFAVIIGDMGNINDAAVIAKRILTVMSRPFHLNDHELFVTASIGIASAPLDGNDSETILRYADAAMYQAKEQGRNNYQFFHSELNVAVSERLTLENDLRRALEREEFVLHYQPQVEISSGRIIGVEALVRWRHPQKGLLLPDRFIPLAVETGLIVPLGERVLRSACTQGATWRQMGLPPLLVAVNFSSRQFYARNLLIEMVTKVLQETGFSPDCLEFELTESSIMQNPAGATRTMDELRRMGIRFAVDNFGTGYSSLGYLKQFSLERLKIDKSFVGGIRTNPNDTVIVRSIIALARSLQLKTIAEGVETKAQLAFLAAEKCDQIQGFLVSQPVPADKATEILRNGTEFLPLIRKVWVDKK